MENASGAGCLVIALFLVCGGIYLMAERVIEGPQRDGARALAYAYDRTLPPKTTIEKIFGRGTKK